MNSNGKPTCTFEILNAFLGWGEPSVENSETGTLWFIGVEEGSSWIGENGDICEAQKEIEENYGMFSATGYKPPVRGDALMYKGGDQIRQVTSKIACSLSKSSRDINGDPVDENGVYHWEKDGSIWRCYLNTRLWKPGSSLFQANLFPIGKPKSDSWLKDEFEKLYGFSSQKKYLEHVQATRFKRLLELYRIHEPQATVCFGKGHWKYFSKALRLKDEDFVKSDEANVEILKGERVIRTRHFSNGCPNSVIKNVISILMEWGVCLP